MAHEHGVRPVIPGLGVSEEGGVLLYAAVAAKLCRVRIEHDHVFAGRSDAHAEVGVGLGRMEIEDPVELTALERYHLVAVMLHNNILL